MKLTYKCQSMKFLLTLLCAHAPSSLLPRPRPSNPYALLSFAMPFFKVWFLDPVTKNCVFLHFLFLVCRGYGWRRWVRIVEPVGLINLGRKRMNFVQLVYLGCWKYHCFSRNLWIFRLCFCAISCPHFALFIW